MFFSTETFTAKQLYQNDLYALGLTFQEHHTSHTQFQHKKGEINIKYDTNEYLISFMQYIKEKIVQGEICEVE